MCSQSPGRLYKYKVVKVQVGRAGVKLERNRYDL